MVDSVPCWSTPTRACPRPGTCSARALRLGLRPIVVVNKVDRPQADPFGALDKTFELFWNWEPPMSRLIPRHIRLGAEGWFTHNPDTGPARHGRALRDHRKRSTAAPGQAQRSFPHADLHPRLSDYMGRIGCGRVLGDAPAGMSWYALHPLDRPSRGGRLGGHRQRSTRSAIYG